MDERRVERLAQLLEELRTEQRRHEQKIRQIEELLRQLGAGS